jgi:sigma-E factor negative regulatory protein RseA
MKSKISALMDGELMQAELSEPLRALREEGEALETWRAYHLISDSLQETPILSSGFSARFAERLALEPTILAPASIPPRAVKRPYLAPLSAAASLAAIALVAGLAIQNFGPGEQQIAQNIARDAKVRDEAKNALLANVPLSGEVNDYLLAHQNFSPRSSLQGVAPYVRTVSDSARAR